MDQMGWLCRWTRWASYTDEPDGLVMQMDQMGWLYRWTNGLVIQMDQMGWLCRWNRWAGYETTYGQ